MRSDAHRAFSVEEKCSQAVELAFSYKKRELHCSMAVQEEVQPDCTSGSAARLYRGSAVRLYKKKYSQIVQAECSQAVQRKCSQAVQEEVQPGCTVELPFYKKKGKPKGKVPF